jgi:hypothetical protein
MKTAEPPPPLSEKTAELRDPATMDVIALQYTFSTNARASSGHMKVASLMASTKFWNSTFTGEQDYPITVNKLSKSKDYISVNFGLSP